MSPVRIFTPNRWVAKLKITPWLLPVFVVIAGFTATFVLSSSVRDQEQDHIWRTISGEAEAASRAVQSALTSQIQSLVGMAKRWEFRKPSMIEWQEDARRTLQHMHGLEVIDWVDSSFETRWSVYTGGRKIIDTEAVFGERLRTTLEEARDARAVTVSRAFNLPHGGTGILIYVPLFTLANRFDGFIASVLNLNSTMTGLLDLNFLHRYELDILESGKPIYTKPGADEETKTAWLQESELKLYGVVWSSPLWKIRVWPVPAWLDEMRSSLHSVVLTAGLLMTVLLTLLTCLFQLVRTRAHQLETANANLKLADSAKSDFLANMSHELRTPLNAVIGFSEILIDKKAGPINAEQQEYLEDILRSGRHLLDLITDILDLTKIAAGKLQFSPEPFSITDAMRQACAVVKDMACKKNININIEEDLDDDVINLDPLRFRQVLYNLLSNAIKFTPENGEVKVWACNRGDKRVRLQVSDTGIGIKKEDMPRLFHEFEQIDSSLAKRAQGSGLGLTLTKKIVELQNGSITAESEFGKGSTFTVVLPSAQET
jgi:signal transduction histidine kinase